MPILPLDQLPKGQVQVAKPAFPAVCGDDLLWMQPEIYG